MNKGKIMKPAWMNEVHDQQAWQPTSYGHSYQHVQQLQHKIYLCTTSTKTKIHNISDTIKLAQTILAGALKHSCKEH